MVCFLVWFLLHLLLYVWLRFLGGAAFISRIDCHQCRCIYRNRSKPVPTPPCSLDFQAGRHLDSSRSNLWRKPGPEVDLYCSRLIWRGEGWQLQQLLHRRTVYS